MCFLQPKICNQGVVYGVIYCIRNLGNFIAGTCYLSKWCIAYTKYNSVNRLFPFLDLPNTNRLHCQSINNQFSFLYETKWNMRIWQDCDSWEKVGQCLFSTIHQNHIYHELLFYNKCSSRSLNNITRKIRCVYYGNYFITITIYRFPFIKHKLNSFKCMQIKCFVTNYNKTFSYVCQAFLSNLIKHFIGNYKKDFQWNRSMNMIFCIRFFATFKENY